MKNCYFHLVPHIYIAQFRDQVILLDTKNDAYTICSETFGNILLGAASNKKLTQESFDALDSLLQAGILEKSNIPYPFYIDQKPDSVGVSNIDWRLPLNEKKTPFSLSVFKALWYLVKVNFYIKFLGFHRAIGLIQKAYKQKRKYIITNHENLDHLAGVVNKACLIYPSRTKCLEWAMTYILMALQKGWKCNLEIGIQNYPFMAHAWVECDGKIIMDSQDLRSGLAIILNEPFRRFKVPPIV